MARLEPANSNQLVCSIPNDKHEKVLAFLKLLTSPSGKISRKKLEQGIGLLLWVTMAMPNLRAHLTPLFDLLFKPKFCRQRLSTRQWGDVLSCLDESAKVVSKPSLSDVLIGWNLVELSGRPN